MTPTRRAMDAASHAHKRESDPDDFARMHHRACDDPDRRFEWRVPVPEAAVNQSVEDPGTQCAWAFAFGALAGCLFSGLLALVLWI